MDENTGSTPTPPAPPEPPAPTATMAPPPGGGRPGPASDTSKLLAALGYIFGVVAIIAILIDPYKDEKFVKFHAMQAIGLWVAAIVLQVASIVPVVGWIISLIGGLAIFVYAIILAIKAFQGEYYEMPVVYGFIKGYVGE